MCKNFIEALPHMFVACLKASDEAARYYRRYVAFVLKHLTRPGAMILDVGYGSGWSTWLLREEGHDAHGTDLHAGPLEAQKLDASIPYVSADVQQLPFPRHLTPWLCMRFWNMCPVRSARLLNVDGCCERGAA